MKVTQKTWRLSSFHAAFAAWRPADPSLLSEWLPFQNRIAPIPIGQSGTEIFSLAATAAIAKNFGNRLRFGPDRNLVMDMVACESLVISDRTSVRYLSEKRKAIDTVFVHFAVCGKTANFPMDAAAANATVRHFTGLSRRWQSKDNLPVRFIGTASTRFDILLRSAEILEMQNQFN